LSESAGFRARGSGKGSYEMDLTDEPITDEFTAVTERATAAGRHPLENPRIDRIPDDPLCEPHPSEPGVGPHGEAAPLENPDDRFSADPLRYAG
jgi:hypothetical protein